MWVKREAREALRKKLRALREAVLRLRRKDGLGLYEMSDDSGSRQAVTVAVGGAIDGRRERELDLDEEVRLM